MVVVVRRMVVIAAVAVLGGCPSDPVVGPFDTPDGGVDVPTPVEPRDAGTSTVLEETLVVEASAPTVRVTMRDWEGLEDPRLLLPPRPADFGGSTLPMRHRGSTPDGRIAILSQSSGDVMDKYWAVDLRSPEQKPVFLFEAFDRGIDGIRDISNTHLAYVDRPSLFVVSLDGSSEPLYLTDDDVVDARLIGGRVVASHMRDFPFRSYAIADPTEVSVLPWHTARALGGIAATVGDEGYIAEVEREYAFAYPDSEAFARIAPQGACDQVIGVAAEHLLCFQFSGDGVIGFKLDGSSLDEPVPIAEAFNTSQTRVLLSESGRRLWIRDFNELRVWDVETLPATMTASVALGPDAPRFMSVSASGDVAVLLDSVTYEAYDDSGELLFELREFTNFLGLSPSGRWLTTFRGSMVAVHDLFTGRAENIGPVNYEAVVTPNGLLTFDLSLENTVFRMDESGAVEQLTPWMDTQRFVVRHEPPHVIVDAERHGLWVGLHDHGALRKVSNVGETTSTKVVGRYLAAQMNGSVRGRGLRTFRMDGRPPHEPVHAWPEFTWPQVETAGPAHVFGWNSGWLELVRIGPAREDVQTTLFETSAAAIAWCPHLDSLLVAEGVRQLRLSRVGFDGKAQAMLDRLPLEGLVVDLKCPEGQPFLLVRTTEGTFRLDLDDPKKLFRVGPPAAYQPLAGGARGAFITGQRYEIVDFATGRSADFGRPLGPPVYSRDRTVAAIELFDGLTLIRLDDPTFPTTLLREDGQLLAFSADDRYLYFRDPEEGRLRVYDVRDDWSRVLTAEGIIVQSVLPVRSREPVVSIIGDNTVYRVDRDGQIHPILDEPGTSLRIATDLTP